MTKFKPKTCDVSCCKQTANPRNRIKTAFNNYTYCNNCWPQIQNDIHHRPGRIPQNEKILKAQQKHWE